MFAAACSSAATAPGADPPAGRPPARSPIPLLEDVELPAVGAAVADPDGEDDGGPVPVGPGLRALLTAERLQLTPVAAPPETAHPLVCDLAPFGGALYAVHAVAPIVDYGGRVHRYDPDTGWSLALDWDGQGFTRARVIDGAIYVPDADTPGPGFGLSGARFEEYMFVSDAAGVFAEPPETLVLPRSFHAFDVIRYRGANVVSGGTGFIGPGRWGPFPGGLHAARPGEREIQPRFDVGDRRRAGVVRTTFLHRFGGRLYMGFQNNERRARWDVAVLTGDPLSDSTPAPVLARITVDGGWLTKRFASHAGALYWIGSGYRGDGRGARLMVSRDGRRFERVDIDGAPQDIAFVDGVSFVLTDTGLYRDGERVADAPAGDPFGDFDLFCSAPLALFDDGLYAGSMRDGRVFRVVPVR